MYLEHFERLQDFAINDLRKTTIHAQANFLVAMGLFNYIEILGSFSKQSEGCEKRFDFVFTDLLGKEYSNFKDKIDLLVLNQSESIYGLLRCGMSHEYLVKDYPNHKIHFQIYGVNNQEEYDRVISEKICGLEIFNENSNEYLVKIYNPKLIEDLNNAFEKFKKLLSTDPNLQISFKARCEEIDITRLT